MHLNHSFATKTSNTNLQNPLSTLRNVPLSSAQWINSRRTYRFSSSDCHTPFGTLIRPMVPTGNLGWNGSETRLIWVCNSGRNSFMFDFMCVHKDGCSSMIERKSRPFMAHWLPFATGALKICSLIVTGHGPKDILRLKNERMEWLKFVWNFQCQEWYWTQKFFEIPHCHDT